jgi:DNA-binding transcriptional ArsR family regulator
MVRFQTSPVYEMMLSLQTLRKPGARAEWASSARAVLPPRLLRELEDLYEPYFNGALFFELAVDYTDHDDVPGYIEAVRTMDPVTFMFYCVGRILRREQIAATGLDFDRLRDQLMASGYESHWMYTKVPLREILADVPAFQNRLADLWQWYWEDFFAGQIDFLRPHWEQALEDKSALLARLGGAGLLEHVTGKSEMLPPLPEEYPVTDIVFIPVYLMPSSVYMFYGYGNITVLFNSERTEARLAELERNKQQMVSVFKALADGSRIDILRLIVHHGDQMHGKRVASKLNLSASAVSRHLAQLKEAGLIVEETQDNRTITYKFQESAINSLPDTLFDVLHH